MAVKLLRCSGQWAKIKAHPCWRVEKALQEMGIDYEAVHLPASRRKRDEIQSLSGQSKYPAIQFEDGSVYRAESKEMERVIRSGKLLDQAGRGTGAPTSG
jgi:glutaredoxin